MDLKMRAWEVVKEGSIGMCEADTIMVLVQLEKMGYDVKPSYDETRWVVVK